MTPSFMINLPEIYPHTRAEKRLPPKARCRIPFADIDCWYTDDGSWLSLQSCDTKHVYVYSVEIDAKAKMQLPLEVVRPDIHWQYALRGGYTLVHSSGAIPVLPHNCKHMIQGEQGKFLVEVDEGRHWILGFNIAESWLKRYRQAIRIERQHMPHTLLRDKLYHSKPLPIRDLERSEIYYLLNLVPGQHLKRDALVYLPIANLLDLQQQEGLLTKNQSIVLEKINAVHHYINQCLQNNQQISPIQEIASHFCIDKDHLTRLHKATAKVSLQEYINRAKLNHAVELLAQRMPIYQVADILGYSSNAAFTKEFKKRYGYPPSQHYL